MNLILLDILIVMSYTRIDRGDVVLSHKNNTKEFHELTYSEQASSINAQINNLEKDMLANARKARVEGKECPIPKRIENLKALINRLVSENK